MLKKNSKIARTLSLIPTGAPFSKSDMQTKYTNAGTKTHANYIDTRKTYKAELQYQGNVGSEVLVGIKFTQN